MLMLDVRHIGWWYWLASALLLTAGLSGHPSAYPGAIALTLVQLAHFARRERNTTAFPVQVRAGYLLLLALALPAPMQWLYWLPAIGTWAQVLFGYCLMARMVSLLPWNRKERLSLALLRRTFLAAPVRGNILHGLPAVKERPCPPGYFIGARDDGESGREGICSSRDKPIALPIGAKRGSEDAAYRPPAPAQAGGTKWISTRHVECPIGSDSPSCSGRPGEVSGLELRPTCEHCNKPLPPESLDARICSYECTFCADCVDRVLHHVCPNCGGGFVPRPIRPARNWKDDNYLGKDPAGQRIRHRPVDPLAHARLVARIGDLPPERR